VPLETHSNKTDGRVRDTRQRILRQAHVLYQHGGYAGINLQELADVVGITKAALFHHFDSKQTLFYQMQLELCAEHQSSIETAIAMGQNTRARLRNIMEAMSQRPFFDPMKFLTDELHQLNPTQQDAIGKAFAASTRQPIADVIAEGVEKGELRPHNQKIAVLAFLNLLMLLPSEGNPVTRYMSPNEYSSYLDDLLDVFVGGVAGQN